MSNPYLPPELLDHTVDLLHDNTKALKECCLVSKSWIPRTRKHLFARIKFSGWKDLPLWMKMFPDPFNSPAYHTHTLTYYQSVECSEASGWITRFSRVVDLEVIGDGEPAFQSRGSLVPFHGFRLAQPQIYSLEFFYSSRLTNPRPHPFIPSSRGPHRDDLL